MAVKSRPQVEQETELAISRVADTVGCMSGALDELNELNQKLREIVEEYGAVAEYIDELAIPVPSLRKTLISFRGRELSDRKSVQMRTFRAVIARFDSLRRLYDDSTELMDQAVDEALEAANIPEGHKVRWRTRRLEVYRRCIEVGERVGAEVEEWMNIGRALDDAALALADLIRACDQS
ncbi:hypothetical protein B0T21DRAFT_352292 [Apiosordaria backusii]|uniref:Uncharacterized protein n=1 Tax=Apiosordaria backusii TaxID=314023 RepID=A0AA40AEE4_9PEZI|nr:hypothetical protein B0T21DRAFT_352292 [Apiosordaria backusii]